MGRTSWLRLLVVAALATNLAYLVLRLAESQGATVQAVPLLSSLTVLVIAGVVGAFGWSVRQYTRGKRPRLDPLQAARTVVLAKAAAYTGALLTGWYGGHLVLGLADLEIAARRGLAVSAAVALLGTLALAAVGLVVERWCEVPPPEDDEDGGASAPSGSAA